MRLLSFVFSLILTASVFAEAYPIARTEVLSDEYVPFTVQLWSNGYVQISRKSEPHYSPKKQEPVAVMKLDKSEFVTLRDHVLNLRMVPLEITHSPVICSTEPPPAISDLFVMSFDDLSGYEYRMVLSAYGCWRGISVVPANEADQERAKALLTKLLHHAFALLENVGI